MIEIRPSKRRSKATEEMIGNRYSRLVVEEDVGSDKWGAKLISCRCDCGKTIICRAAHVRDGSTHSCGCMARDKITATLTTHGMAGVPEYSIWKDMRARCSNPKHDSYQRYGGRGITICDEWDDFERFMADMGPRPSDDYSIDRIDNDGPYSPENCQWATQPEQQRNTSRNRYVTFKGQKMTMTDAARAAGLTVGCLRGRFNAGWPEERLFEPPHTGP